MPSRVRRPLKIELPGFEQRKIGVRCDLEKADDLRRGRHRSEVGGAPDIGIKRQAGFLAEFAPRRIDRGFSDFYHALRERPGSFGSLRPERST